MQYMGGKSRLAKRIAAELEKRRPPGARFVEPFCGALNITAAMSGERIANDACAPLITLYRAWRKGWRPPEHVSEDLYHATKVRMDCEDPLTAFVGFGCSFGGKWFAGYARPNRANDYTRAARNTLERKLRACDYTVFTCTDYSETPVFAGDVVYLDPPYAKTTGYLAIGEFDQARYLNTARAWAALGAHVYASEYIAHPGFEEIAAFGQVNSGTLNKDRKVERLFRVHP